MSSDLTPQSEQYLASVVAGGLYPSKQAALEAAVDALREKTEGATEMPPEHESLVEAALESVRQGQVRELTARDVAELRRLAKETSGRRTRNS